MYYCTVWCARVELFFSASTRLTETDAMPTECGGGLMAGRRETALEIIYAIFSPSKNQN